jgi:diguanylate cyclase (GGDEF)-like protein/PAS domain S-box-containing protein
MHQTDNHFRAFPKDLPQANCFLDAIVNTVDALVVVINRTGHIVLFNHACEVATGYKFDQVQDQPFWKLFIIPEEQDCFEAYFKFDDGLRVPSKRENVWLTKDGCQEMIAWSNTVLRDVQDHMTFVVATGLVITEHKQAEDALQAAEQNYRGMFENALDGIFQTTRAGHYLRANSALARIYGYETPAALIETLHDIKQQLYVDPRRRAEFVRLMRVHGSVTGFEAQIYRRDGEIIWITEDARAVYDASNALQYYEGHVQDITHRKTLEAEKENLLAEALERADHDPLTGLLNHRAFHKRYQEETARASREGTHLAVAVMDLDNFKFFNDAYGHAVGDDVLRRVAETLLNGCRPYDTLARFGGDEFALLMPNTTLDEATALTDRLRKKLAADGYRPLNLESPIPLTLSAGLAVFPEDGEEKQNVLEAADVRLMRTKTGGSDDDSIESLRELLLHSHQGFLMLDALVTAVDNKDRYTRRHSEDVMRYVIQIAADLNLDKQAQHTLQVAALLHDVGKIGVPDRILRKPGLLTDEEFDAIRQHPMMGAVIVGAVPGFEETLEAIRHHHERWDGEGYPFGLAGCEVPQPARIMAVADAYSAMTMDRPYRQGKLPEDALQILLQGAGSQWDPECVAALQRSFTRLNIDLNRDKAAHTVD